MGRTAAIKNLLKDRFPLIKKAAMLVSVCLVLFIVLECIDIMVYLALTQKSLSLFFAEYMKTGAIATIEEINALYQRNSALLIGKSIDFLLQGIVIFFISFLIVMKNRYNKKYWVPSLLIVLMIHTIGSPDFYYSPNFLFSMLFITLAMLTGIFSIYLSGKVRTSRR